MGAELPAAEPTRRLLWGPTALRGLIPPRQGLLDQGADRPLPSNLGHQWGSLSGRRAVRRMDYIVASPYAPGKACGIAGPDGRGLPGQCSDQAPLVRVMGDASLYDSYTPCCRASRRQ